MRVLSVRLPDEVHAQVERARIDAGQSRTDWLRSLIAHGVEVAAPARPPERAATQFCTHPASKRLGNLCVACGSEVYTSADSPG